MANYISTIDLATGTCTIELKIKVREVGKGTFQFLFKANIYLKKAYYILMKGNY